MALNFGLTSNGYIAPSYEEILEQYEEDFRSKFGKDIVLTSNSNAGILARIFAYRTTQLLQEQQKNYYSNFYTTAEDSALDRLGSNIAVARKIDRPSNAEIVITTSQEYLIQAGEEFETEDGILFVLIKDVLTTQQKDGTWSGIGQVQSEETGEMNNVPPNSITIVSNPDDNIISVTNPHEAVEGQDYEEDPTFRKRLIMENSAKPGPTEAGVKSALYNLQGVRDVNIVQNPDGVANKDGDPPYSFHIYVLGGRDEDIAETIYNRIAVGTTLAGSKHVNVVDNAGEKHDICFDNAKIKQIYVKVTVQITSQWNDDEGSDDIKGIVAEYINGLTMGETVYLTRLYPAIYNVKGISEAIVQIGEEPNNYGSSDIKNDPYEAPKCNESDVQVVIE